MTERPSLAQLLVEYDRALAYTERLWHDLTPDEVHWRPVPDSSAIGWHLGHQAAVAHYMMRNLTAAEPSLDPSIDALMDSATEERQRGDLPSVADIADFRATVADRIRHRVDVIDRGDVGAPTQLRCIAETMLTAIVNHEYQHATWIGEVRSRDLGHAMPERPESELLTELDGYPILRR